MQRLSWKWDDEEYFRSLAIEESERPGVLHLELGQNPPMSVVLSARAFDRLLNLPVPISITSQSIQLGALKVAEEVLQEFNGVDLDTTLLVSKRLMPVSTEQSCTLKFPVVAIWCEGRTTILQAAQVRLGSSYFADLQLLRAELFHRHGGVDD